MLLRVPKVWRTDMASAPPDPHPDSPPTGPSEAPEQLSPQPDNDGRESVEDVPEE